jgi:hypothetical protein
MPDQHLGYIELVDGSRRPVFEGSDGRQYIHDDDGERWYDVWIMLQEADEPIVVPAR